MARRRKLDAGSGRNWMPHLESHQDLRFQGPSCYCCTTGQILRMAAKVAWPDYPKAIGPRFIGDDLLRWYQRRTWRGTESPDHFLGCIGIKSARVGVFCIHRRKCHLAGAFAPSSWMVWQDLRMKREDAAMGWYWAPWMTSWLLVETIRLPVLPRSGPVYKTGASAARPSRKSAAHGSKKVGSPGFAPGPRRLRVGCTVLPIL
jgi:hypothetical protein